MSHRHLRVSRAVYLPAAAGSRSLLAALGLWGTLSCGGQPDCVPGWSPLGSGIEFGTSYDLRETAIFDAGQGPELYISGTFVSAGGMAVHNLARWNGRTWSDPGIEPNYGVTGLLATELDGAPVLLALLRSTDGPNTWKLGRYDGTDWTYLPFTLASIPPGQFTEASSLAVFGEGAARSIYVGGFFAYVNGELNRGIVRWDGAQWRSVGGGVTDNTGYHCVFAFQEFGPPGARVLVCGGEFDYAGALPARNIAAWTGTEWVSFGSLGQSVAQIMPQVTGFAVLDEGNGPVLFACGTHRTTTIRSVARWHGTSWLPVGPELFPNLGRYAFDLAVHDDGAGPALYAVGTFDHTPEGPVRYVARWDSAASHWVEVGGGTDGSVFAVASYSDETGPNLIVFGDFQHAGGRAATRAARYGCVRGDVDCGGAVNNFDIDAFVLALTDPDAYAAAYPNCPYALADVNRDGAVNNLDIDAFVDCLIAGVCP